MHAQKRPKKMDPFFPGTAKRGRRRMNVISSAVWKLSCRANFLFTRQKGISLDSGEGKTQREKDIAWAAAILPFESCGESTLTAFCRAICRCKFSLVGCDVQRLRNLRRENSSKKDSNTVLKQSGACVYLFNECL